MMVPSVSSTTRVARPRAATEAAENRSAPSQPPAGVGVGCCGGRGRGSSLRRCSARLVTSERDAITISAANTTTAAIATVRNARVSRTPSGPSSRLPVTVDSQPVAGPEDCFHQNRFVGIELDLAAQVLHVGIDGAFVPVELIPPQPIDQLRSGEHAQGAGQRRAATTRLVSARRIGRARSRRGVPRRS